MQQSGVSVGLIVAGNLSRAMYPPVETAIRVASWMFADFSFPPPVRAAFVMRCGLREIYRIAGYAIL